MTDQQSMKSRTDQPIAIRLVWRAGALAAAVAVVGNLLIFIIGQTLLGVPFIVPPAPGSAEPFVISAGNVVLDSVAMALGATVVFTLLSRITAKPMGPFYALSAFVLLLSLIFPLLLSVADSLKVALCLMHILAAVIIVGVFKTLSSQSLRRE